MLRGAREGGRVGDAGVTDKKEDWGQADRGGARERELKGE